MISTNRALNNWALGVNLGGTLDDLLVWTNKSSSNIRLHRRGQTEDIFKRL